MMAEELEKQLKIDVTRVDPEGEGIEGEVDCIDIDEELVHPFGGVRYRLALQLFGTEFLVRGHLEQDFDLVCSRCGKDFDDTVEVDDFTMSYEIAENASEVDLTADVREAILLALPNFPVCDENCPGIRQQAAMPSDSRWSALDALAGSGGTTTSKKE